MKANVESGAALPPQGGNLSQPAAGGVRAPFNVRQFFWITLAAIAVFVAFRLLPTGTNLSHMDFRATGTNSIEFCDPLNPQFISVVAVRSPVTMTLAAVSNNVGGEEAGRKVDAVVTLKTGSDKPITPADLLITHTMPLHLLIIDSSLSDYQHVHPQPGKAPGEWLFSFTPQKAGAYRVFADFTPTATGRGLYASADIAVGQGGGEDAKFGAVKETSLVERDGFQFSLVATPRPVKAGQPIDLRFSIARADGAAVPMKPVMGAYAHLVAFDDARSGFAHLHPVENPLDVPDAMHPVLNFKLTIPQSGRYVIWAQVNLGRGEVFVPFWFEVL